MVVRKKDSRRKMPPKKEKKPAGRKNPGQLEKVKSTDLGITDLLKFFYVLLYQVQGNQPGTKRKTKKGLWRAVMTVSRETIQELDPDWMEKVHFEYIKELDSYRISLHTEKESGIITPDKKIILSP